MPPPGDPVAQMREDNLLAAGIGRWVRMRTHQSDFLFAVLHNEFPKPIDQAHVTLGAVQHRAIVGAGAQQKSP